MTGWAAAPKPLKVKGLHCCSAVFSWKLKATAGFEVTHCAPLVESFAVKTRVVPPALNPVASDMTITNCEPFAMGSWKEYDPCPLLNALSGIEIFRGVPKVGTMVSENGAVPPVQVNGKLSHCDGVPNVYVNASTVATKERNESKMAQRP